MSRLFIATWGSPIEWDNVNYVVEPLSESESLSPVESCTTLIPLLEYFCSSGDCDITIVVLDSLIDLPSPRSRQVRDSSCTICCEGNRRILNNEWRSYIDLRRSVEEFVKEVVKCLGIKREIRVIVAPAIGSPGGNRRFNGKARDFEAVVLYELGKLVLDKNYDEIILDLTHGINFMPSLTLRVAYRLASLLLLAHKELGEVKLLVYNSDPYKRARAIEERIIPEIKINLVVKDIVKNIQLVHRIPSPVKQVRKPSDTVIDRVKKLVDEYFEAVRSAYSALYYPLPLALATTVNNAKSPLEIMDKIIELWLETIEVGDRVVNRILSLNPDALYLLLLVEATRRRLQGIVEYPTSIKTLKEIAEVYSAINQSYHPLITIEIGQLEKKLSVITTNNWVRYCDLYEEKCKDVKTPDKRIMIAHAGLQKEIVEVHPSGLVRYTGRVEEILRSSGLLLECEM